MKHVKKRSIVIGGRRTSVSIEEAFWDAAKEIAAEQDKTLAEFVGQIDRLRQQANLSSAIRLRILDHYKSLSARSDPRPQTSVLPSS